MLESISLENLLK